MAGEVVTWNSVPFLISGWPHPTRTVTQRGTTGKAQLVFASPLFTSGSPKKYIDEFSLREFERAVMGWTQIDPVNPTRLNRNFPFPWPKEPNGALAVTELNLPNSGRGSLQQFAGDVTYGPTLTNLPPYDYWPGTPKNLYDATFGPLPWNRFLSDAVAYAGANAPKELGRYINVEEIYVPREFRRPDYGFVTDDAFEKNVLQVGFIPFIQAEVKYTWFQVPYSQAVPWVTIANTLLHVNSVLFDVPAVGIATGRGWPVGSLLFTRTGPLDNWYHGPGGQRYVNVEYNFTYSPYGWNNYVKADNTIVALKRKGVVPATPPYPSADFNQLFNPAAG